MKPKAIYLVKSKLLRTIRYVLSRPKMDYIILAIIGLHIFSWFGGNLLYFGGDITYPFNPSWNINSVLYTWQDANGGALQWSSLWYFAYSFFYLLTKAGLSLVMTQRLYFYLFYTLSGIGMYYLISVVYPGGKGKRLACWIAALFYMFNPTLLKFDQVYFPYAVLPFILAFFIKGIDADTKGKVKFGLLTAIACFGIFLVLPSYMVVLMLLLMLAMLSIGYMMFNIEKVKQLLQTIGIFSCLVILVNLWALIPSLFFIFQQGFQTLASTPAAVGAYFPDFYGGSGFLHALLLSLTYPFYFSLGGTILIVNLLFTVLAFSALLLKPRSKMVLFFALFAVISIVLNAGVDSPFADTYSWMVANITILKCFRHPWYVSAFVAICYSVLIGVAVSQIYRRIQNHPTKRRSVFKVIAAKAMIPVMVILVILILINGWPLVTGDYFRSHDGYGQWNNNGGHEIPSSYYAVDSWLNAQDISQNYRVLQLPPVTDVYEHATWSEARINSLFGYEYFGAELERYIFTKPLVWDYQTLPIISTLFDAAKVDYGMMAKLAGLLNIKYVINNGYYVGNEEYLIVEPLSGSALKFDENNYVEVPNSVSLNLTDAVTLEAWINPSRIPFSYFQTFISKSPAAYEIYGLVGTDELISTMCINGVYRNLVTTDADIKQNTWSHVVMTFDGENWKIYVNGEVRAYTTDYPGEIGISSTPLIIGNRPTVMDCQFFGAIDEVRILNRALTDEEVKASYNRRQAVMEDGVVALWHFDEGSGTTAIDNSSNGDDGTIRGAAYIGGTTSVAGFDKLEVFRIDDKYVFPRVYATSKVEFINGGIDPRLLQFMGTADFSDGKPVLFVQEQLSLQDWDFVNKFNSSGSSPEITFEQLNPTKYVAHINSSKPCFLVLSTKFDQYWAAYIDGKEVGTHLMANGYANAWYIDKTGSFDVVLNYKVQDYFYIALVISGLTFIGCLWYIKKDRIASVVGKIRRKVEGKK
jgi:hypothetical protein